MYPRCVPLSAYSQLEQSRHSHMLEKSLGLLSLLLVLINAHRPLIEVSLTGHTHDRAPSARARAPRGAAPRARARRIETRLTTLGADHRSSIVVK